MSIWLLNDYCSEFGQHYVSGAIGALHVGELEAIRLGDEISADIVILDDIRQAASGIEELNVFKILLLFKPGQYFLTIRFIL